MRRLRTHSPPGCCKPPKISLIWSKIPWEMSWPLKLRSYLPNTSNLLRVPKGALPLVRENKQKALKASIAKFYANGALVGKALSKINPKVIGQRDSIDMMQMHNEQVVELATLRAKEQYEEYIEAYERYYAHILRMADTVHLGLIRPYGEA